MNTKLNFLMVLALLVILVGASAGVASAEGVGITIGPDTLSHAVFYLGYSQQLTASGGTAPYTFTLSGALPSGITLSSLGLLSGRETESLPGDYPITVQVTDANLVTASRDYIFVLDKATPSIEAYVGGGSMETGHLTWNKPFDLLAYVELDLGNGSFILPPGTVAFSIDGDLVPGCGAVALSDSLAACRGISMILDVGEHTFQAVYSPAGYEGYYYPATSSLGTFTVDPGSYYIWGNVFIDENRDGVWDETESWLDSWTLNLTTCTGDPVMETNGNIIGPQITGWGGWFQFSKVPGGQCVRVSEVVQPGWQATTPAYLEWDNFSENVFPISFGVYYPTITVSGPDGGLPDGTVGVPYPSQVFSATGGEGSYTFTMTSFYGHLPDGLSLSTEGELSGTPTLAGGFPLTVQAEDANHTVGSGSFFLKIMTDGTFTLTSSSNPSTPSEAVTFTLSGTGEALFYYTGQKVPPYGQVTFQADGVDIQGCIDLDLSNEDEYGYVYTQPAVCTTSALGEGTHEITALYTDWTEYFHDATLTLEQEVTSFDVTSRVMLPEPSLAGYPIVRTYVYFTGPGVQEDYACTVDYGDGTVQTGRVEARPPDDEFICSDEISTNHIYQDAGSYTLTFKVTNLISGEEIAPTIQHEVVADTDPGYITRSPDPVVENQPVTFSTSRSADNYEWFLVSGPGIEIPTVVGFDQSFAYTFSSSGTYKMMLVLEYYNIETNSIYAIVDGVEVTVLPVADLSITKTDRKDPVKPGARLIYTLMVSNVGPDTAENIFLQDTLDKNTSYVSVYAPSGWTCKYASGKVSCTSASLASGSSATIQITVTVSKTAKVGKELVNNASVSSTTYDPNLLNNKVVQKTMVSK